MLNRTYSRLELIVGPMFAGKTEELMRQLRRYRIAGDTVQSFKHRFDDRYSGQELALTTHAQAIMPCDVIAEKADDIFEQLNPTANVIGIDEGQFYGEHIIDLCKHLRDSGRLVIVSALNQDFRGEAFPLQGDGAKNIGHLIAIADVIIPVYAMCTYKNGDQRTCSAPATRTQRIIDGKAAQYTDPINLPGAKEYQARCAQHHDVPNRPAGRYSSPRNQLPY